MIELDCCKRCKYKRIAEFAKQKDAKRRQIISYYVIAIDSEFYDGELMYYTNDRSWIHDIDYASMFFTKESVEHEVKRIKKDWKGLEMRIYNVCSQDSRILFTAEM